MEGLDAVKKQLKSWESGFIKKHNRKPNKGDIDEDGTVKELYRKYASLKKQSAELSVSHGNTADVSVWGHELNKSSQDVAQLQEQKENENDHEGSFMKNLSRKLLSKASEDKSRFSFSSNFKKAKLSVKQKQGCIKDSVSCGTTNPASQSSESQNDCSHSKEKRINTLSDDINCMPGKAAVNPLIVQNNTRSRTSHFMRQAVKTNRKAQTQPVSCLLSSPDKKISSLVINNISTSQMSNSVKLSDAKTAELSEKKDDSDKPCDLMPESSDSAELEVALKRKRQRSDTQNESLAKRSRVSRQMQETSVSPSADEQSANHHGDESVSDVQWQPHQEEQLMVDLDLGPESVSPVMTDGPSPENTKIKKKTRSGGGGSVGTNQNFVRLNMKVKSYRRKGQFKTGSAYKRMAWKQKMVNRSKASGTKCFKCGEEGHWAKQCKGKGKAPGKIDWSGGQRKYKSSVTPSITDDNTDSKVKAEDFPSMREAVQMAYGIKSKKTDDNDEEDVEEELAIIREGMSKKEPPQAASPLLQLKPDGSLPDTPDFVHKALRAFGFSDFRLGQEKVIMRILCGQSTLVMLSTGAGKSLCYQLPAVLYSQQRTCITLVISPLVSLMEDQVTGLPPGVRGACLHTNMTKAQQDKVKDAIADNKVHFLLVSPEALVSGKRSLGLDKLPQVAFACIDEVHCVSEWSHHFRPSYLRLCKVLRESYGVQCMLGLTATATMVTAASVAQHLGIHDYKTATIRGTPVPDNLLLSVSRDEEKEEALISLLQGERFGECDSIIVYCTRRQQTDRIATLIRTCLKNPTPASAENEVKKGRHGKKAVIKGEILAECYHAGMSAAQRKRVQNAFMSGRLRIIVATVAFGMGLDKSDVRGVIHYDLPKTFESYVQEIGRAGRDGQPAHCHLFLSAKVKGKGQGYSDVIKRANVTYTGFGQDLSEVRRHIHSNSVDRITVKRLVQYVFPPCKCRELQLRLTRANKECEFDDDGVDYTSIDTSNSAQTEQFSTAHPSTNPQEPHNNCLHSPNNATSPSQGSGDARVVGGSGASHRRSCEGHERAVPVEELVNKLDMKEEGISTLLYYLELHPRMSWLENLPSTYATCRIQCYGGPQQLLFTAKKSPAVAVAIAHAKRLGQSLDNTSQFEFNVVDLSDSMGWSSSNVRSEIRLLQWQFNQQGAHKTGVMVEFSDLAFHFRALGDLSDQEVDDVIDFLSERLETQERTELFQLDKFFSILKSVSHKHSWMCADSVDHVRSNKLKSHIAEYFEKQPELKNGQVTMLSFAREMTAKQQGILDNKASCENEAGVRAYIRAFIHLYSADHSLNGRTIARIFHGIGSPCFPPEIWGKVRRFWRCHLDTDFHVVRVFATQELAGSRR